MSESASGTFDITGWDQHPYDTAEGATLARVTVKKAFLGDLVGTSVAELLIATSDGERTRVYVALERVSASLYGREGTFVLRHSAIHEGDEGAISISVVPDTATGDLAGLRGDLRIQVDESGGHAYTLDYDLPEPDSSETTS